MSINVLKPKLTPFPLIYRAAIFSVLVNIPTLVALIRYGGYSNLAFSDWDEPFYLPLALKLGDDLLRGSLSLTQLSFPHDFFLAIIGSIPRLCGIRPIVFGALSDLLCCFASYWALVNLFKLAARCDSFRNDLSAIVAIMFPWMMSVSEALDLHSDLIPTLTFAAHHYFESRPVFRGLSTQYSFVLFVLAIWLFLNSTENQETPLLMRFWAGVVGGLLLYVYFFAWGAFYAMAGFYMLLEWRLPAKAPPRTLLIRQSVFVIASVAASAPGILFLLQSTGMRMAGPQEYFQIMNSALSLGDYWFLSPINTIVIVCLGAILISPSLRTRLLSGGKTDDAVPTAYPLFWALLCAEFLLMNSQPILRTRLEPYHFPLFFLHPLGSGLIFCIAQSWFSCSKGIRTLFIAGVLLMPSFGVLALTMRVSHATPDETERTEMFRFLAEGLPRDSAVATLPFSRQFSRSKITPDYKLLPYWIKTLSGKESFSLLLEAGQSIRTSVERELAISWLYTGQIEMLLPCPVNQPNFASDILTGATAFEEVTRLTVCHLAERIKNQTTPCHLLKSFRIDYIVEEPDGPVKQSPLVTPIWQSSSGSYRILKFNQASAMNQYCR